FVCERLAPDGLRRLQELVAGRSADQGRQDDDGSIRGVARSAARSQAGGILHVSTRRVPPQWKEWKPLVEDDGGALAAEGHHLSQEAGVSDADRALVPFGVVRFGP